ncbi:hypothetical protein SEA_LITTLEFELLA_40 [Gordonia phage LittleFella]|nr:hypothetical protein SEA_LITTLEFELLA_40 [Gordonia phage LittleFella]
MATTSKTTFKVQYRIGNQTYLAPVFEGDYRECRRFLADKSRDLRGDPWYTDIEVRAKGGPSKLGEVRWWDHRDTFHQYAIRFA